MTFFHDLNKRLAALASKQDAQALTESATAVAAESKFSKLAKEISKNPKVTNPDAVAAAIGRKKYGQKAMTAKSVAGKKKANEGELGTAIGAGLGGAVGGLPGAALGGIAGHYLTKDDNKKTNEAGTPMTSKQKSFAKLAPPTDKITFADKIAGAKKEVDEMLGDVAAEAIKGAIGRGKQQVADEGNAFTGKLKATPKGGKFKMGNKEYTDNSDIDEGFADMDAWLASREKEKGTGKFDRKERTLPGGMKATTYTRKHDDDTEDDSDAPVAKGGAPKKKGRPMGKPKGPERVTKGAWKHKAGRVTAEEDVDTDGVMMTRPTNCSSEAAGDPNAIKSAIALLKKNGFNVSKKEEVEEKAVSQKQQKFMGMVHAAQKGEKPASKEVAKVAKEMPKKAAKDFASTKHKGLPVKVKAKKEESKEEVEETTVAGSVATASASPKASKGGMQFGKGVYESLDRQFKQALTESITVESTMSECGDEMGQGIVIKADGEDAAKLMALLKLAGLEGCPSCGRAPCGCESLEENSPDWPTDTETLDADPELRTYSGGLNGPKSTGQSTTPVLASQLRRQASMEESVKIERNLFNTWKNYKG